jgi:hypothetical protein
LEAFAPSTMRQYLSAIRVLDRKLLQLKISWPDFIASKALIMKVIGSMEASYKSGSSITLLNSAITFIKGLTDEEQLAAWFRKASKIRKPKGFRYEDTFDVTPIIQHLNNTYNDASPPELQEKTLRERCTTLLALALACRSSDLARIDMTKSNWTPDAFTVVMRQTKELRGSGHKLTTPIVIHKYCNVAVCPVTHVGKYISLYRNSLPIDDTVWELFVTIPTEKDPNRRPLASKTISGDILRVMTAAKVDTTKFKTHAIRGASVSNAIARGITLEEVMRRSRISSTSTLFKYYLRDVRGHDTEDLFSAAVLNH